MGILTPRDVARVVLDFGQMVVAVFATAARLVMVICCPPRRRRRPDTTVEFRAARITGSEPRVPTSLSGAVIYWKIRGRHGSGVPR